MDLRVLNGQGNKPHDAVPSCTIVLNDEASKFNDFVCIGVQKETGRVEMFAYSDTLLMGMAMKMITDKFHEQFKTLDQEQQLKILGVLNVENNS